MSKLAVAIEALKFYAHGNHRYSHPENAVSDYHWDNGKMAREALAAIQVTKEIPTSESRTLRDEGGTAGEHGESLPCAQANVASDNAGVTSGAAVPLTSKERQAKRPCPNCGKPQVGERAAPNGPFVYWHEDGSPDACSTQTVREKAIAVVEEVFGTKEAESYWRLVDKMVEAFSAPAATFPIKAALESIIRIEPIDCPNCRHYDIRLRQLLAEVSRPVVEGEKK